MTSINTILSKCQQFYTDVYGLTIDGDELTSKVQSTIGCQMDMCMDECVPFETPFHDYVNDDDCVTVFDYISNLT